MFEAVIARLSALGRRLRRVERRELREFRLWIEHTGNLLHLTVLVFVPLIIGLVTYLSNTQQLVSFLIFPPLAAGTYTLFAEPEGKYSSPTKFVGGMTLGALSGWVAVEVVSLWRPVPPGVFRVHAGGAALAIFLTGLVTWALDLEEPTAFSTALLVLLIGGQRLEYVVGVALSSALVAAVFTVWRDRFYEERARYLYRSTWGDDDVLVPMRDGPGGAPSPTVAGTEGDGIDGGGQSDPDADGRPDPGAGGGPESDRLFGDGPAVTTALFGAELAAAHEAGRVTLLDVVDDRATARAERAALSGADHDVAAIGPDRKLLGDGGPTGHGATDAADGQGPDGRGDDVALEADATDDGGATDDAGAVDRAVAAAARELETLADEVERELDVPCEVVVAVAGDEGWSATLVTRTAGEIGCDLVVTPYEAEDGAPSGFVRGLFDADVDVIAFRSVADRRSWERAMVPVRKAGAVAHAMVDFARRVTGPDGRVSVCHCIASERRRRRAETMLADLLDAFDGEFETRIARTPIDEFVGANALGYDVVFVGASTDRTAASRLVAPPTFRRLDDVDTDVAVVHRAR